MQGEFAKKNTGGQPMPLYCCQDRYGESCGITHRSERTAKKHLEELLREDAHRWEKGKPREMDKPLLRNRLG